MSTTPTPSQKFDSTSIWCLGKLPPSFSLFVAAALLGLIAGMSAFVLKTAIRWMSTLLVSHFHDGTPNWGLLIIPAVGIILTVAYQKFFVRRNLQHGSEQVEKDVKNGIYDIPATFTYGPLMASTLTLGFGGSAGAEGPIATCGAATASMMARKWHMPTDLMRILIGCGAGAGIAGIFKAPVGGVMFTIEVMGMELATVPVIALIIACVIAGMTSYGMTGFLLDVPLTHPQYFDPSMSGWMILLGCFCGFYSMYYSYAGGMLRRFFERIPSVWIRGAVSGGILSVLIFLFPAMYGEGYDVMARLIDGDTGAMLRYSLFSHSSSRLDLLLICGGIVIVKTLACTSTNSGGGVAGDFAPTLFAGCFAGYLFASTVNLIGGLSLPAENFALVAMAGAMAGIIRAPLMAIFIVVEMTGYYGMMFPVVIVASISFALVSWLTPSSRRPFTISWRS